MWIKCMGSSKTIQRLSLGIMIVVFWIMGYILLLMGAISNGGGTAKAGANLIFWTSLAFSLIIYPALFIYSMYSPSNGGYALLLCVVMYAVVVIMGILASKIARKIASKKLRRIGGIDYHP